MDYLKKRDYFGDATQGDGIGHDLRLIDRQSWWQHSDEPFIADATNAAFLTRGSMTLQVNMKDYVVKAPAMVIILEGMVVRQDSCSEDAAFDVVVISRSLTDSILSEANVSIQLRQLIYQDPVFPIAGSSVILRCFNFLLKVLVKDSRNQYRVEAVKHMTLTLFCGFALNRQNTPAPGPVSRKDDLARQFLALVRDNYREERMVAWYAGTMCVTPKYLSQVVKDVTGKPALDWIDEFTVVESKALLKSTNLTVDQISTKLGFLSSSLFGKYFKRVTGMSPREYRQSV